MTLFIVTKKRQLEISDLYVMLFIFVLTYSATYLITKTIKKRFEKDEKVPKKFLFSGGQQLPLELEAAQVILQCVKDDKRYLVIDPEIAGLIRRMLRQGFIQHSYIISLRFARYLARRLANSRGGALVRLQNGLFFTENYVRFVSRVSYSVIVGIFGGLIAALYRSLLTGIPIGVLAIVMTFIATADCGVKCDNYFRELPPNQEPIEILVEREHNNIVIASNDDKVEIFTPELDQTKISGIEKQFSPTRKIRAYKSTHRRAKLVKFSEWRKTDPVLKDLDNKFTSTEDAPYIPQSKCPITGS